MRAADDPPPYDGPRRALVYSDRRISDTDRARLVHLVADLVPLQYWRTVKVDKGTGIDKLVDCYYDALFKDAATRRTAIALQEEIQRRTLTDWPLTELTTVMMPPFPAIAERKRDPALGSSFRVYDTLRDAYSITKRVSEFKSASLERVADLPVVNSESRCPARLAKRAATFTAVIVPVDQAREALMRTRLPPSVQQLSVGENAQLGRVRIELLQDVFAACLENANYLTQSPFWAALKARVATLGPALVTAAADLPLVILDQNFADEDGHGFRVRNVATTVLKKLELPETIEKSLVAKVEDVDLCPRTEKDIKDLRARVTAIPALSGLPALDEALRVQANAWLDRLGEPCVANEFDVPDLVLASVLRRELAAKRWLIMSFRARGSVESLMRGAFDLPSISIVAAGNEEGAVLDDQWMPQIQASKTQRVILVTHGDEKGVLGTASNLGHEGLRVDTMAPGCGVGEMWTPGSSFAAPLVAVAVWLKELVKRASQDTASTETDLRSAVTAASRPSVSIGNKVQAAGVFDLGRYVVAPLRHIRFRENVEGRSDRVVPVIRGQFAIKCVSAEGGPRQQPFEGIGNAQHTMLYTVLPGAEGKTVITRQLGIRERSQSIAECAPESFSLSVTYADDRVERFGWKEFTEQVAEVSF